MMSLLMFVIPGLLNFVCLLVLAVYTKTGRQKKVLQSWRGQNTTSLRWASVESSRHMITFKKRVRISDLAMYFTILDASSAHK